MGAELERALTGSLAASRAGREVCAAVVQGAVRWALQRYPAKEAEKAAKARLHQFYGSYVNDGWVKRAEKTLAELACGGIGAQEAAAALLALHSSTRERLGYIEECYGKIFSVCGKPATVLDIACGLNPVSFRLMGMNGVQLTADDAGSAVTDILNRFFAAAAMPDARAYACDVTAELPQGRFDLALVMKFLPLAERLEKGGAVKLMNSIDARHIAVSFPTRSLSGRNVGMERNYSEWFEGLGFNGEIMERFISGDEVFYIIKPMKVRTAHADLDDTFPSC